MLPDSIIFFCNARHTICCFTNLTKMPHFLPILLKYRTRPWSATCPPCSTVCKNWFQDVTLVNRVRSIFLLFNTNGQRTMVPLIYSQYSLRQAILQNASNSFLRTKILLLKNHRFSTAYSRVHWYWALATISRICRNPTVGRTQRRRISPRGLV